jgi:hypothetical protein
MVERIDPFPNKAHPYEEKPYEKRPEFNTVINNQKVPLFGSFASTFLPAKKREQIVDIEE